jgi:outer membrane receptor for ferrienterochelin and colicin
MRIKKIIPLLIAFMAISVISISQVTTSSMNGTVKTLSGADLAGASITATHTPTGTVYSTTSRKGGIYNISNMNPGGPYTFTVSFVGYKSITREGLILSLGETLNENFELLETAGNLTEVVVATKLAQTSGKGGTETSIGRDKMANLPTVGRNVSDYLRFVPQAKITGDGGVSLAGQNNRYNSFYIDGAVNNDVFGLSASGTNGGQAGIAPISIDAIDQFQVVLAPYDAALGNFTGGGINAITRSGTNNLSGSVYYFFRNEELSGKTPGVAKSTATKLSDFSNSTIGFRLGGAIIKNKLFFFINGEVQRDKRPQPFDFSTYTGASNQASIDNLSNYLISNYGYDGGGYIDNPETVEANRVAVKLDWNISQKHKLSGSYRYNDGFRNNTSRSSNSTINYLNNGYVFPTTTHSASLELNSKFNNKVNNKLLLTLTDVTDDRGAMGDPFPRVTINDGTGRIIFGTEEFSTGNLLEQNNIALFDVLKLYKGKHVISIGTDNEFSKSTNIFIRQNYGSYVFPDLATFIAGGNATTYNRSYSLLDPPGTSGDESVNAAAKFNTLRLGFFVGDEIKLTSDFTLTFGLRADNTKFLTTPKTDKFFNDTAISKISVYHDLQGARSGQISSPKWSLNPRIGFVYKIPEESLVIRGGFGLFTGRVPLVWPGGVYNNNGISLAGINASNVAFREDPTGQYIASDFGITVPVPSGQVDLISEDFRMNKIFRTSLAADKQLGKRWKLTFETIITKNINEINYDRVDILPANLKSVGVDVRDVYSLTGSFTKQIPLRSNGTNPYTAVYLLSNSSGSKGFSYNFTVSLDKSWNNNWAVNANYSYGNSIVLNEGTSSQNNSQWRFMEAVNGRNNLQLSTSDYDPGHRINAYVAKKFTYLNKKLATTISLVYNGQSGNTYSYVLNRGLVRDLDNFETNDLIFVPNKNQLNSMVFLSNTTGGVTYTPQQQRDLFDAFIESDKYLKKHRGQYAERNGARTPFTHILDLKLQQDLNLKFGEKTYQLQITYDIFNFTNFIDRDAGKQYFATNDQSIILDFTGYVSTTDLTPQYRFTPPANGRAYNISDGVFNSSRWTSQLGIRLSF